jgi:SAM-dependent methyltransferase
MRASSAWEQARPAPHWFDPFFAPLIHRAAGALRDSSERPPRLLHLGCGVGVKTEALRRMNYEAVGIDIDVDLLNQARRTFPGPTFVHGDMQALPFEQASFDVVFSFSTLQLVEKKERVLAECARVLRPGGRAVFIENLRGSPLARGYRALVTIFGWHYRSNEKPKAHLDLSELSLFEERFTDVETSLHHVATPLTLVVPALASRFGHRPMRVHPQAAYDALARLDDALLLRLSWTRRLAWHVVATMKRAP